MFILITDGKSVVKFKAQTPEDYGTFQCWAENSVGQMSSPCYYHILPAGENAFQKVPPPFSRRNIITGSLILTLVKND